MNTRMILHIVFKFLMTTFKSSVSQKLCREFCRNFVWWASK